MNASQQQIIRIRADHLCEYCRLPEVYSELKFVIDHIIARQHDGKTSLANLALSCGFCNRHKGPNVAGFDPRSHKLTPFFHPRQDQWREHFRWRGSLLNGVTAVGRVTVHIPAMNHPTQLAIRRALIAEGIFPS